MAVFTPTVPGAPAIDVKPDVVRGAKVFVAGVEIRPSRGRGRPSYDIPMTDGTTQPLVLYGSVLGLRAAIDGREYPVEPRLTWIELFLVVLPLALIGFGGLIGIVVVGLAVMLNLVLMKRPWPLVGRAAAVVAVFLGAAALLLLAAPLLL